MFMQVVLYFRLWKEKCNWYEIDESFLKCSCRRPSGAVISNPWKQVQCALLPIISWFLFINIEYTIIAATSVTNFKPKIWLFLWTCVYNYMIGSIKLTNFEYMYICTLLHCRCSHIFSLEMKRYAKIIKKQLWLCYMYISTTM